MGKLEIMSQNLFMTIFRSLIPVSTDDQNLDNEEENTKLLEKIFLGVTTLVVVLIIVLIYVTNKTRNKQNRFKLLDNSGNLNHYQSRVSFIFYFSP